jgi:hypothetical protein
MLRGTAFLLVTGIGLLNMFLSLSFSTSLYENTIYPVTYHVNEVTEGSFSLFLMILITFYSGLLVWKEREPKFDEVHDATPIPWASGSLASTRRSPVARRTAGHHHHRRHDLPTPERVHPVWNLAFT